MDVSLRRFGMTWACLNILGGVPSLGDGLLTGRAPLIAGFLLLLSGQLVIIGSLLIRTVHRRSATLVSVLTWVGVILAGSLIGDPGPSSWWPLTMVLSTVGFAVLADRGLWGVFLATATTAAFVGIQVRGSVQTDRAIANVSQVLTMTAVVILVARAHTRATATAELLTTNYRDLMRSVHLDRVRGLESRRLERFIHDEVLHVLRALAMDRQAVSAHVVRGLCCGLVDSLKAFTDRPGSRSGDALSDLVPLIRRAASVAGVQVRVQAPPAVRAPSEVAQAISSACVEALRNVARHSGVLTADVEVRRDGLGVVVTIVDRGSGFDPATTPCGHHGVADSIVGRMQDVGGTGVVRSPHGEGSTVTLSWRSVAPVRKLHRDAIAGGAVGSLLTDAAACLVPNLVLVMMTAVAFSDELLTPWVGIVATLMVVIAAVVAFPTGLRRGLSRREGALLSSLACLASVANGTVLVSGDLDTLHYWLAGGATSLILFVILMRPLRESLLPALVIVVYPWLALSRVVQSPGDWSVLLPCLLSPLGAMVGGFGLRRLVDSFSREVFALTDAAARWDAVSVAASDDEDEVGERLRDVSALVLPLVGGVADGALNPADCVTRDQAGELEQVFRDDLMLGVAPEIRRATAFARSRGWVVKVRCPRNPDPATDRHVASLLVPIAGRCAGTGAMELCVRGKPERLMVSLIVRSSDPSAQGVARDLARQHLAVVTIEPGYIHLRSPAHTVPVERDGSRSTIRGTTRMRPSDAKS